MDGEIPALLGVWIPPNDSSIPALEPLNEDDVGGRGGNPLLTEDKETTDSASFGKVLVSKVSVGGTPLEDSRLS